MQPRLNRFLPNRIRLNDLEDIHFQSSIYIIRRRLQNIEDEALLEAEDSTNINPIFMKEKDINFRLYPFYINWKQLEENEKGYFHIFVRYGYFGASIYSLFKEKYPILNIKNILFTLSNFIPDFLLKNYKKDPSIIEDTKYFFDKMPDLDSIYQVIQNKIIMFKEISIFLIVLKIYEIYFISKNNKTEIEKVLKSQFLLGTYLTDEEYENIYKENFKGKVYRIFKKLAGNKGKEYELVKKRNDLFSHIKYVYKKYIKDEHLFI